MDKISLLQQMIDTSKYIVFFGGAGVSTESGLKDFRSVDGLYNQQYDYPPETILSRSFFDAKTKEFFRFYKDKLLVSNIYPNAAHYYLTKLEESGKLKAIITQNIDNLHTLAGSKNVIELHGSINRNYCMDCKRYYEGFSFINKVDIPRCSCGGIIKPDVVLYEESLDSSIIEQAIYHISKADLLIIGGTSLTVYPAASFVRYFKGENLVLINKDKTQMDDYVDLVINEPIGQVFSKLKV